MDKRAESVRPPIEHALERLGSAPPALQVSHVRHEDLESADIPPEWILTGAPKARVKHLLEAADHRVAAALWDCTQGSFRWHFGDDELVHILAGEVTVSDTNGALRTLREGDVAYFAGGTESTWQVETYVKKLAVYRQSPPSLAGRARQKLASWVKEVAARHRN